MAKKAAKKASAKPAAKPASKVPTATAAPPAGANELLGGGGAWTIGIGVN